LIPEARYNVCARKRDTVIKAKGSADNIRASGHYSPRKKAEDMTAPTIERSAEISS